MRLAGQHGQTGFLPIVYEDNIESAILNKFLFNNCLNALGALTKMTYGELVTNPNTRHLIANIADETKKSFSWNVTSALRRTESTISKILCCLWSIPRVPRTARPCSRMSKPEEEPKLIISMAQPSAWGNREELPHLTTI
jgi:hypothetical protein